MPLPELLGAASSGARYSPERRTLVRTWGDHLQHRDWTHAVTVTTSKAMTVPMLRERFRVFVRNVERTAQNRVPFFAVPEGLLRGRAHMHALVAGTAHLTADQLAAHWKYGGAHVVAYDATQGFARYLVKGFGRTWDVFDSSKQLPPRRDPPHDTEEPMKRRASRRAKADAPSLTMAAKAQLWDSLTSRAVAVKLEYTRGKLTCEAPEPEHMAELLQRVLGVLGEGAEASLAGAA